MLLTKYSLWASLRSLGVFYIAYIPIVILSHILTGSVVVSEGGNTVTFVGFDTASSIFMFILGIALFNEVFKMAMANSMTRKNTFISSLATAAPIALLIAVIDRIVMLIVGTFAKSSTLFFLVYAEKYANAQTSLTSILTSILWESTLLFTVFIGGYFLGVVFYKLDKFGKLLFSLVAFAVPIVGVPIVDEIFFDGRLLEKVFTFIIKALGINTCNPFMAVLSLLTVSAIITIVNYVLIARVRLRKA